MWASISDNLRVLSLMIDRPIFIDAAKSGFNPRRHPERKQWRMEFSPEFMPHDWAAAGH
jgi:hypothetical protein